MNRTVRILAAAALLLCAAEAAAVYTVNGERKSFEIFRTDSPPVIDGKLDDAVWQTTASIDDFHQTSPRDGSPPTEQTGRTSIDSLAAPARARSSSRRSPNGVPLPGE